MPRTVSPGAKQLAFSIQVPSSSRWVRVKRRRSRSTDRTAARIFCPGRNRSDGWEIRETEMYSMGSMATMPQPMSTKAPKDSSRVTTAATTDPGRRCSRKIRHGPLLGGPAGEQRLRRAFSVSPEGR